MSAIEKVRSALAEKTSSQTHVFQSPGRINLIGEHTDYNEGFVFPAAIDKCVTLGIAKTSDGRLSVNALDLNVHFETGLEGLTTETGSSWTNYFMGVLTIMRNEGLQVDGLSIAFTSDIPIGAGLSSSAAICCCIAFALNRLFDLGYSKQDLVRIGQRTEHEFIGVLCGTMDQTASLFGRAGYALKIDCRSQEIDYVPISLDGLSLVICDSRVQHTLADSGYNQRRKECEEAVSFLQEMDEAINSLRDVDPELLERYKAQMPAIPFQRASFVVNENRRVVEAAACLVHGDMQQFGQLMYASHHGLSEIYEVSCDETDFLVNVTKTMPYVLGSRMMGGGFGGCTLSLVATEYLEAFETQIKTAYSSEFNIEPPLFALKTSDGTRQVV